MAEGGEVAHSGTFTFPDGSSYSGEFTTDASGAKVRSGKGLYTSLSEKYLGGWAADRMSGEGVYTFASGAVYQGGFLDGFFHGFGTYTWPDGARYAGNWLQSKMHGEGVYVDAQQIESKGFWYNGAFDSGRSYVSLRPASIPS